MKELKQIAKDCGLTSGQESLLYGIMMRPDGDDATVIGAQDNIIGALYRRIEKLEEENASFVKDMKLQSYRLAELEAWTDENQGI